MEIKGIIHSVDIKSKSISIKIKGTLHYFYFQNNLLKRFKKYLYPGNCITLVSEDSKYDRGGYFSAQVIYVIEIFIPTRRGKKILYNKEHLNKELLNFFDSLDYVMFLDIEMTMPNYNTYNNFIPEIIQAGFFVVSKNGDIVEKYNYYIRPTKTFHINKRTRDFLHIDNRLIAKEAVSYFKFYNKFKSLLNKYHPAIMTYGKNDKLFIERSYNINELPSLSFMSRFINLAQLIKNYYELKSDPGLFHLYEKYTGIENVQTHDALEDAEITYEIYKYFVKDIVDNNYFKEGELLRALE